MAGDLTQPRRFAVDDRAAGALPAAASRSHDGHRPVASPHAGRFRAITAALIGFALGAIAIAVIVVSGSSSPGPTAKWSDWKPSDGGQTGTQEIADFVAPYYRATPANQLAVVTALNLNNPANPLQIALPSSSSTGGVQPLPPTGTVAYELCGVGSHDCSIGVGTPSSDRLLLLRREALELALYTFKYISGTQTVVAILPPGHTQQGCTGICPKPHSPSGTTSVDLAVAFDRAELAPWLRQPLRRLLPEQIPPTVGQMPIAPEAELVSIITAHGLFQAHQEQAQDGSTLLLLNPVSPQ